MERINRFFAAFLLLAYLCAGTPCLSMATLIFAELEGSHLVLVTETAQGTRVQLHHKEGNFTPEVADHDNTVGRWLVKISKTAEEGDHVISCAHLAGSQCGAEEDSKREVKDTLGQEILPLDRGSVFKSLARKVPLLNPLSASRWVSRRLQSLTTVRMLI